MFKKHILFKNFLIKKNKATYNKVQNHYYNIINEKSEVISSLDKKYKDSFSKKIVKKFIKIKNVILIGMGGSILGAKAIYSFLNPVNKKFYFIDSFFNSSKKKIRNPKITLIISKSGNTLETISNSSILFNNKKNKNIFITENKRNYLNQLASDLKSEVIHHNNFIGGRYSVLSEVGMLPAQFMGFKPNNFRKFNELVKDKFFVNSLINNVSNIFYYLKKNKTNSIILNYDKNSNDLFYWYQQLVAESLGKKKKGILPVISEMPKDNHSLMQYYLDGVQNNFFTLFFVKEKNSIKIKKNQLLKSHHYLKNKSLNEISFSQFVATGKVFKKKQIPFRSFVINKKNEETLGNLFIFFILETILLGRLMNINPYNQPSVELIKKQTYKILVSK